MLKWLVKDNVIGKEKQGYPIWKLGNLEIRQFGNLEIRQLGNLEIWKFGNEL